MSKDESNKKDYDVGYGKPPKATQFKRGRSGNPAGRPKGAANIATILQKYLAEKLDVIENGCSRRLSKLEVLVRALLARAAKGDIRAIELLIKLLQRAEVDEAQRPQAQALPEDDVGILERYFAFRSMGKEVSDGEPS